MAVGGLPPQTVRTNGADSGTFVGDRAILALGGDDTIECRGDNTTHYVDGGEGNDSIGAFGGPTAQIFGGNGNDTLLLFNAIGVLVGGAGDDSLTSALSAVLRGGSGNDTLTSRNGGFVAGELGNDVLRIDSGDYTLSGGGGVDTLTLHKEGAVDLRISGEQALSVTTNAVIQNVEAVVGSIQRDTLTGSGIGNFLDGAVNDDILKGLNGADTLLGGGGVDRLDAGNGDDLVSGGTENDILVGGAGADTLDGGAGIDTAIYSAESEVTANLTTGVVSTGGDTDRLIGVENLVGSDEADSLRGDDTVNELTGGNGNDTLAGGGENDRLSGDAGSDILDGGVHSDILIGGFGRDVMSGGADSDRFDFNALAETGVGTQRDAILDFAPGADKIDVTDIDADVILAGEQDFAFVGNAPFSGVAGELRSIVSGGITLIEGDVNGDAIRDFQIQLSGALTLSATDFVL